MTGLAGTASRALLSHWRRHPLQLFTLIAGLALATALWAGVQAINAEARASYAAASQSLDGARLVRLLPPPGRTISEAEFVALRRAGWLVSPVIEGRWGGLRIIGFDPLTAPAEVAPVALARGAEFGAFLSEEGAFAAHPETFGTLEGTGASLIGREDVPPGTALTDLRMAARLLGREGYSHLLLAPVQPLRRPPLEDVAPHLRRQEPGMHADPGALTESFHLNLTAFGLLSFAVGLFIVHGTVGLAFEQRHATVRTLRALGMPLGGLIGLMAAELAFLAAVAGLIGLVLGYLVAAALLPDVAGTLRGLYGAEVAGTLRFRPGWAASALAIAMAGTAIAAAGALHRLVTMPLLAGGTRRGGARWAARRAIRQAGAGLALLAAALAAALWGRGLVMGFATLGALMVGAALLLPLLLDRILSAGHRLARHPLARWAWADARTELPGLSLAFMALLLAMAASLGVSTMVSSFRETFRAFLDQRLAFEFYVQADTPEEAEQLLAALPEGVRAVPVMGVDLVLAGQPAEILALRDDPVYRANWRFLAARPDPWDRLAAGEGVFVSEQLARRAGLWPGTGLEIVPGLIRPVLAVYADYGNPLGQAILTEELFRTTFPGVEPLRFALHVPPDAEGILPANLSAAGLDPARLVDQHAVKTLSMQVFERTFAVTAALSMLTLGVAGFALLMSLLTLADMRLPQLAPVWALGVRRATLGWTELARALGLAALTGLVALPLGLMLAWVLLAVVNVEAFGWRLPMKLFPLDWLRLFVLALLVAALAAAWPARHLARTPPGRLLKVFADER
ncbi:ABC-type antimicrobial peptide transport system, permease component [Rubellimicrobium thermophilum DSM 16684]|uniref:ABC-type antimicrobial peptide transport system, permease component n=1 Tax=Rubellimicrobium thermophilum DSM 16684 TaxID=1123069 RepID=S9SHN0_9RHOB|nr:ABC transporter permease [Rubellimicrobium thermophilum]EPX85834.1 ABC-type antimicrobial peptide transport system, permease component [Rubellimicrobium thermophilum DSM 16684]